MALFALNAEAVSADQKQGKQPKKMQNKLKKPKMPKRKTRPTGFLSSTGKIWTAGKHLNLVVRVKYMSQMEI